VEVERSLAEAFVRGERAALGELYERVGPLTRNYLWMLTRDPELADDLVQEVFCMAFRDRQKLRDPERVVPWILRIARSIGYTELRRRHRRQEITFDDDEESGSALSNILADDSPQSNPFELLANDERGLHLRQAMDQLRPKERELVAMIYFLDMKQREAAEALDITVGSVGTTLRRALEKMKAHLEQAGLSWEELQ
jgi:RNA polymerase sigma-70 factor (ECF subfamily)